MNLTEVDQEDAPQEDVLEPELSIVDPHHHLWPTGYRIPTTRQLFTPISAVGTTSRPPCSSSA